MPPKVLPSGRGPVGRADLPSRAEVIRKLVTGSGERNAVSAILCKTGK